MPTEKMTVLASNLCKTYEIGDVKVEALKYVNLKVKNGEFAVISGPSGSGKATLLNIISGIDKPTSGRIIVFGKNLGVKDEHFLAIFHCRKVGFVFQSYNLISTLTVAEGQSLMVLLSSYALGIAFGIIITYSFWFKNR